MDSGYYERYMLSKEKLLPKFKEKHLKKGLDRQVKKPDENPSVYIREHQIRFVKNA